MVKKVNTTSENVQKSISSIYDEILKERTEKHNKKVEKHKAMKEAKDEEENDKSKVLTKKEKAELALSSWKDVISGLTGDDLDYIKPKKKGKPKYKKWIDDDNQNIILTQKPKKKKKVDYNKEFEQEINILKRILAKQDKFTDDLEKRFQSMAGPNTKDAMPLNKNAIELANAVANSRNGTLSILKEINNTKKTKADLYMKDRKINSDMNGSNFDNTDVTLMGSSIASQLMMNPNIQSSTPVVSTQSSIMSDAPTSTIYESSPQSYGSFDPDSWEGVGTTARTKYESVNTETRVVLDKGTDNYYFKTINKDTGEELSDFPHPKFGIEKMDLENNFAKDGFDKIYPLEVING